jgi:hypothetical protein
MRKLKSLVFYSSSLSGASVDIFVALLQCHKRDLLPNLKTLDLNVCFSDAVAAKRFYEAVTRNEAFASVKKLIISEAFSVASRHININLLASALSGGAFAGLEALELRDLDGGDDGLTNLCQALERSPCADTLKELCLIRCEVNGKGIKALGSLFATGALPRLEKLQMANKEDVDLGDVRVVDLMEGFKAACHPLSLTSLDLMVSKMDDATLGILLSAIECGRLPALEELILERTDISDEGAVALSQTIQAGHLENSTTLQLTGKAVKARGALLIAAAVSVRCPELTSVHLPIREEPIQIAIKAMLEHREDLNIYGVCKKKK